ncbi:chorismate synthase [Flavobacterium psychrophilum]|uniref:chorismate synthase n=1 Tax=Flavobacterium psychrophilum TaxID=96345 RepID=UPI0004F6DC41|nr:chorismate synthase [Flavobacterium psychrophilum]AIN73994.1 chorismate synthase [Flavobacterium psychrophilum FPG3]EKT2069516.1 chorismate synthase [Flavobacterium psychrophilum]EKT2071779.1 chorismate synthase [Flavobacterium psychrophilum]EKT4491300.1 chorismate synthase [Flavobacterium psychrophilum]MBF2044856.1 chorismate synthase [Flavobacterium psychrophilum]
MSGNSYGKIFKITTFGESHGEALGGIIDGCPPNIIVDLDAIQIEMQRRKPGQSSIVTQRKEADEVQFLSGIFEGKTTGTSIGFIIKNTNQKSDDYSHIKDSYRPSHADYVYEKKYGIRDYRGGGRSSARETASRVVAGAIAKQVIPEIKINAFVSSVGDISLDKPYQDLNFSLTETNAVRCPDLASAEKMENYIKEIKKQGDTVGGTITCVIQNVPIGLGEPVFDKLHAELGKAMLSINAVKGFEYGSGFCGAKMKGSNHNDPYNKDGTTRTNLSGGIQGGISNGMDIYFRIAFKPVATLIQKQEVLTNTNEIIEQQGKGRHDPCVVPRAVPIVEAMAAIVMADFFLLNKIYNNH